MTSQTLYHKTLNLIHSRLRDYVFISINITPSQVHLSTQIEYYTSKIQQNSTLTHHHHHHHGCQPLRYNLPLPAQISTLELTRSEAKVLKNDHERSGASVARSRTRVGAGTSQPALGVQPIHVGRGKGRGVWDYCFKNKMWETKEERVKGRTLVVGKGSVGWKGYCKRQVGR